MHTNLWFPRLHPVDATGGGFKKGDIIMKRWVKLMVCLFFAALAMVPPALAAIAPAITIGRVYYIEGDLLRYVAEEKDWVSMVKDAPFGEGDTLYSGNRGMAEMIVPNGTWIRIGENTQIQFIALDTDLSETDIASGVARFYNKSSRSLIKTTSPFGYVLANPGAVFDFYVGENSVEVVAVKGKVSFVHAESNTRYEVSAGSPSILADQDQVSSGEGTFDPDWDRWNRTRENFWAAKARVRGRSLEYLPPGLQDESYALEENGRWESVPYEGSSRWFWRPTRVTVGWSPFTAGRWTDWNGDQVWVPAEPFGYITHHYGNWVYVRNRWYWAPPVATVRIGLPLLNIGFFWSPGRVSWIHSGSHVGWVPLAPRETYYSHRNWGGPHEVVVTNVNITQININIGSYAYARHAIVVPRDRFYGVNSYRNVRETRINPTTIINNYRAAPVVNNTVINNYTTNRQRYNFTNTAAREKPHNTVINRIEKNAPLIQRSRQESAASVQEQVKSAKEGRVNREVRIETPKSTSYIVPANEVNRPKSEIKLQQKEIRKPGRGAGVPPEVVGKPGPTVQPGQPVAKPEPVTPVKPGERDRRQIETPARVAPARPSQPKDVPVPERVAPVKPGEKDRTVEQPVRLTPARPDRSKDVPVPERVAPARPSARDRRQIETPAPVAPARQAPPGQVVVPQHVAPAKAGEPKQVVVPEHVAPVKPEASGQVVVPQREAPAKPGQTRRVVVPEHATPVKPDQKELPGQIVVPRHTVPAQPGQPKQVVIPEHVIPVKPVQQPTRAVPTKPDEPPKKAAPVKSSNKDKPSAETDRKDDTPAKSDQISPAKPEQKEKDKEKVK
jgi:hypothetical protein